MIKSGTIKLYLGKVVIDKKIYLDIKDRVKIVEQWKERFAGIYQDLIIGILPDVDLKKHPSFSEGQIKSRIRPKSHLPSHCP